MAWQHSRQKLSPVKISVFMVTRLMSHLYRCFVYVMQNRAICALPFDWERTFLCGACDSFCGECYQALSRQLLIKRGWGLGTRLADYGTHFLCAHHVTLYTVFLHCRYTSSWSNTNCYYLNTPILFRFSHRRQARSHPLI